MDLPDLLEPVMATVYRTGDPVEDQVRIPSHMIMTAVASTGGPAVVVMLP